MSKAKKLVSNPSEPWDNRATAAQQQTMQRAPVPHCSLQNTAAHWLQAVVMSSHGITVPILPSSLLNTSSNITPSVHFRLWLVTHEMRIQFHPLAFGTSDPEYSSSFRGAYLKCEKFMSFIIGFQKSASAFEHGSQFRYDKIDWLEFLVFDSNISNFGQR